MALFKDRKEKIGLIIALFSAVIFGLGPVAGRGVYVDGGNVIFVLLITTFFRAFALYGFAYFKNHKPFSDKKALRFTFLAGILQALSLVGIFGGAYFMPAAVVIIIMLTYSLILLLFLAWRKEITLNYINVSSTLLALIGLAFVLNIGSNGTIYPLIGIAFAALATLSTFGRTYIFGQEMKSRHPILVGAETLTIAFILISLAVFIELPQPPQTETGWWMLGLCTLSVTIGSFGLFYGISFLGSYKYSMINKLEPIFTTIFGILLIGDFLSLTQYFGIGLVLLSLMALQLFDKQKT